MASSRGMRIARWIAPRPGPRNSSISLHALRRGLPAVMNTASDFTILPAQTITAATRLRVATYNIHKGVRGLGAAKRLEIHNLVLGVEALDADLVFLQEVRRTNRMAARHFPDTRLGWPKVPQADYLAPEGYDAAYVTNAVTKHGEHGNALLSRWPIGDIGHHDVSDHRFEQRGLLHVPVHWNGVLVHAIVAHFGLIHSSRVRQVERLARFIEAEVPKNELVQVKSSRNCHRFCSVLCGALAFAPPLAPLSKV